MLFAAFSVLLLGADCGKEPDSPQHVEVTNLTSHEVELSYRTSEEEAHVGTIGKGSVEVFSLPIEDVFTKDGKVCAQLDLVARTLGGRILAERPSPLCRGDEWRIQD